MTAWLRREGHVVNRKRVRRLMRQMGLQVIWQKPNTSKPNPEHKVYPYLLRGLTIDRPNQVWATDITYIPMPRGFFYLVAIMDWHSRKVLSWRLSNTMDAIFCVEALEEALALYGRPEIFNSDHRVPSLPARPSPACWRPPASGSAWTAKAAAWTMFSWNACGAA
jgi:putative transposase